jgi:di/tricarboxylate transporter
MMPLSYAAVLGGCCTLIGTSTNLVVNGLLIAARGPQASLGLFDPLWVGLPCAGAGLALLIVGHRWLLPVRRPAISEISDPREYTVEMIVDPAGPLVGRTIEAAGLRHLPRCFLAEIERQGEVLAAVGPQERLRGGDRLVFVGVVDSVVDLQRFHGLLPATNQVFKLDAPRPERCLIETVVAPHCPIVGQTIRDGRFRTRYNAVVIAVARSGQRINRKIGDIVLQPGDNLLLEAHPQVVEQVRHARDFYLVSEIADSAPPRHERAILAALIMLAMVLVASFEYLSMLQAALLAAGAMVVTRCCTLPQARRAVDWQVLIAIAASFALGRALESSGLAAALADTLAGLAAGSPWLALVVVYGLTLLLTEVVTNNAAAVLAFPIGLRLAEQMDVSATPFVLAVMLAASLGFATPLGYQTHLMVYGPGGYRLADFLRAGVPLDLICWAVAVIVLPLAFPF